MNCCLIDSSSLGEHIFLDIDAASKIKAQHLSVASHRLYFEGLNLNLLDLAGSCRYHFLHLLKLILVGALLNQWRLLHKSRV